MRTSTARAEPLFVDSGGFIAALVKSDPRHSVAAPAFAAFGARRQVTTGLVVAEACNWLRYHIGFDAASDFVEMCFAAENQGFLEVVRVPRPTEERALALLRRHRDLKLSWTDATSVAVMEERGLTEVFGFDRHFLVFGRILVP